MKNVLLLFPTQLFYDIDYLNEYKIDKVIIYEEPRYFTAFRFHKLKLLYHRVTCKEYEQYLEDQGVSVAYIDFNKKPPRFTHIINPLDHELLKKYKGYEIIPSQFFTLTDEEIKENQEVFHKNNKFQHSEFYKWQRKRLDILLHNDKPVGNKWSFDTENRKKIPNGVKIPTLTKGSSKNIFVENAKIYIEKHFKDNYGDMNLVYPINHANAKKWLKNFVKNKLQSFGKFQDASMESEPFLFHSVLSPMMNIGLLTDWDVIDEALKWKGKVSIASLEGFIRQVIGWRNYVYAIYVLRPEIRKMNFFNHTKKLSDKWWYGIGIEPLDDIIQNKIVKYAYTHHIERLMYLGAFMLISEIHPKEVYRYFMEWSIDAYDWVMVPNIYGMSQFADGGIMMKRPYFSSSNYIRKMSNYKKGDWCEKWDDLFYRFINKHKAYFKHSYNYAQFVNS